MPRWLQITVGATLGSLAAVVICAVLRVNPAGSAAVFDPGTILMQQGRSVIIPPQIEQALHYGHAVVAGGVTVSDLGPDWHLILLAHNIHGYVDYRGDDGQIYWTKKMVTIPAGEPIVTNGAFYIRARCGNKISFTPVKPTLPIEPTDLDTPEPNFAPPDLPPLTMADLPPPVDLAPPQSEIVPPSLTEATPVPPLAFAPFYPVPFVPIFGAPGISIAPAAPTPEPGTLLLMASGLCAIAWKVAR